MDETTIFEVEGSITHKALCELRDNLIAKHKQVLATSKALQEEYNSKAVNLNEQNLLLLGQIQLLNSLVPEEMRIS